MTKAKRPVLVIGSSGMLGSTVATYLDSVDVPFHAIDRSDMDLSTCSYKAITNLLGSTNPGYVINCAGIIRQRTDATMDEMVSVNALFPQRVANACEVKGVKLLHISTDCVFDGSKGGYTEDDRPTPVDAYALTKLCGEPPNCMVIRTSIIGEEQRNKLSLLEWVKERAGQTIHGFTNHKWNGITTLQLAQVLDVVMFYDLYHVGIVHVHGETVTKCELVELINEVYQLGCTVTPTRAPVSIDRTLSTTLPVFADVTPLASQVIELMQFWQAANFTT